MRGYIAVITLITILATSAAYARDGAAPIGASVTAPYGYLADHGVQATWAVQQMDAKTLSPTGKAVAGSSTAAAVVNRGRGSVRRHGDFYSHPNRGHSFISPYYHRFHGRSDVHRGFGHYPYGRYYYYPRYYNYPYRHHYPGGFHFHYRNPNYARPYFYYSW